MKKLLLCLALASAANARFVTDQTTAYDPAVVPIVIGGTTQRIVAQTITAGIDGYLARVSLGVACDSGSLVIDVVDLATGRDTPGSTVLSSTTVDPTLTSGEIADRTFTLDHGVAMSSGHRFAIILHNDTGACKAWKGPRGDSYPRGNGFFRDAPTSDPDSWLQFLDFGTSDDLGFTTIVSVTTSSPPCLTAGFVRLPGDLPICRCIEDSGLVSFRCALLNPNMFLFREVPFPIDAGDPFIVRWTLVAFGQIDGDVIVNDILPQGFQTTLKGPLVFSVKQLAPGQSMTLEYKAIAGKNAGTFKWETGITLAGSHPDDGRMTTTIDVVH